MQMDFLPGSQTIQVRSKGKGKGKGAGAKAGQTAIELALVNIVSTQVCALRSLRPGPCAGVTGVKIRAHVRVRVVE